MSFKVLDQNVENSIIAPRTHHGFYWRNLKMPKSALILIIIVSSFLISELINKVPSTQPSVPVIMMCFGTPCISH